jgi:hypothetical protein
MDINFEKVEQTANKVQEAGGRGTAVQIVGDVATAERAFVSRLHDRAFLGVRRHTTSRRNESVGPKSLAWILDG